MEMLNENQISGRVLDHLGLVADKIDDLNLIGLIDERLLLQTGCGSKVTMGERVAAMILNGLGFINTRLYLFADFLQKKPVARLFGKDLEANWFNDDSLGRCLDAIAAYGTTKLFTELSFEIGRKKGLLGRGANFDTTTLQLSGEFFQVELSNNEDIKEEHQEPHPAKGYSKSKRHDLKQIVLNLATTGQANFPIWMESHSGNASDKKILPEAAKRMNTFCQQLRGVEDFIYVGDSAMYSNVLPLSSDIKWLTRVPENISEAKQFVSIPTEELEWTELPDGYSYTVRESDYGSIKQRWVMIYSEQAYKRETKTLERNIVKEKDTLKRELWHLSNKTFSCIEDAKSADKQLAKKAKYHFIEKEIIEVTGHKKAGRPAKDTVPKMVGYKIKFSIKEDLKKISMVRLKKGRFILATNELDKKLLPDKEVLKEYKAQSGTESGFKFIKDNTFELDSVFLKTPSRIDALMMVMTLCLMIYGVSQHDLRTALQRGNKSVPNQQGKPTQKPTMKWIYLLFYGAHELTIKLDDGKRQQVVINVNALLKEILDYFGHRAREIYLNPG